MLPLNPLCGGGVVSAFAAAKGLFTTAFCAPVKLKLELGAVKVEVILVLLLLGNGGKEELVWLG